MPHAAACQVFHGSEAFRVPLDLDELFQVLLGRLHPVVDN
jgi:hypothetical protein